MGPYHFVTRVDVCLNLCDLRAPDPGYKRPANSKNSDMKFLNVFTRFKFNMRNGILGECMKTVVAKSSGQKQHEASNNLWKVKKDCNKEQCGSTPSST